MSSILYGAEASMDAGSVLSSGLHIVGLQHPTNISQENSSSESDIETGSISSFASNTAEINLIGLIGEEMTDGISLDTGAEGTSKDAAFDLPEATTEGEIVREDLSSTDEIVRGNSSSTSEIAEGADSGFEFFPVKDPLEGQIEGQIEGQNFDIF